LGELIINNCYTPDTLLFKRSVRTGNCLHKSALSVTVKQLNK